MIRTHKHEVTVRRLVQIQLAMGLIAIVVLTILKHNLNSLFSGLVGVFVAVIPTIVYARIAFSDGAVVMPSVAYSRHKKAMLCRFILNLLMFMLVIMLYRHCDFIALFAAYFATLAGYWVNLIKK